MKTRIIHTKIYFEDDWFYNLSVIQKFLFIYLITNSHIGLTGIYELPDRVILSETRLELEDLIEGKKIFEENKKILFYKGWIKIVNAEKYAQYLGEKNETARNKELNDIPLEVKDLFSRYPIYTVSGTPDTTINHKSETINQKSEDRAYKDFLKKRKELGL